MKILTIFTMMSLMIFIHPKTQKSNIHKYHDTKFAATECPKGCSLCTNGSGINSQCTACVPGYALNAPACVPKYQGGPQGDFIPWWGLVLLVLGMLAAIPLIVLLTRVVFYRNRGKGKEASYNRLL